MFTHQLAQHLQAKVVPSLGAVEHIYQFSASTVSGARRGPLRGEKLVGALQTAICSALKPARSTLCCRKPISADPSASGLSQYLASCLLTCSKWWLEASSPIHQKQMETISSNRNCPECGQAQRNGSRNWQSCLSSGETRQISNVSSHPQGYAKDLRVVGTEIEIRKN